MPTVTAPQPQQPTATELANWQAGRNNARQQYENTLVGLDFQRQQAGLGYGIQQRQMAANNAQTRGAFDDPYIGRGIFNSGIRKTGLTNMYTAQANDLANAQQQYLATLGGYDVTQANALGNRTTALANLDAMELARRADLAAQIKGIV